MINKGKLAIVNIKGGFGNQLFQFSLANYLKGNGFNVFADLEYFSFFEKNPINLYLTCATGDSFINSEGSHLGDVVDMEAYAIARVCKKYDVDFKCFKYISDKSDENAASDWKENIRKGNELFQTMLYNMGY